MLCPPALAQPVVRDAFPPEEFVARRDALFAKIGDGVAIVQGTTERPSEQPFRQANQFFYLTGVAEPRAIARLDGRMHETNLFLLAANPVASTALRRRRALSGRGGGARDDFKATLAALAVERRPIYTSYRPEVLGSASQLDPLRLARAGRADPWDGRASREEMFRLALMAALPGAEIRNLDPLIDELHAIKNAREIAVLPKDLRR